MKRKRIAAAAIAAGALINMSACGLYAPPKTGSLTTAETTAGTSEEVFNTETNIPQTEYGPPVSDETKESTEEILYDTDYNAEDNLNECVYGPPEWFEE